jgi:hypothetical protein
LIYNLLNLIFLSFYYSICPLPLSPFWTGLYRHYRFWANRYVHLARSPVHSYDRYTQTTVIPPFYSSPEIVRIVELLISDQNRIGLNTVAQMLVYGDRECLPGRDRQKPCQGCVLFFSFTQKQQQDMDIQSSLNCWRKKVKVKD